MNSVVDGLMTNYQKTGSGKVIVLLHGWGDNQETFDQLAKQLQDKYTLLTLDLPGFGDTEPPPAAWGIEDYAKFVNSWLDKIDAGNVYTVVGHSFGGSIAIIGASSGQIRADKIVLLASGGVRNKNFVKKKALWLAAKTLKAPLYLLPSNKKAKIKKKFYRKIGSDLLLIPNMRQTFVKMVREDVQLPARSIKQPTLLIYGSEDRDTPTSYGQVLTAAIPDSRLKILPGVGHFLHHEKPEEVARLIKEFIN